jgi:hypothetical protein
MLLTNTEHYSYFNPIFIKFLLTTNRMMFVHQVTKLLHKETVDSSSLPNSLL